MQIRHIGVGEVGGIGTCIVTSPVDGDERSAQSLAALPLGKSVPIHIRILWPQYLRVAHKVFASCTLISEVCTAIMLVLLMVWNYRAQKRGSFQ
jgi:hypothetical protein